MAYVTAAVIGVVGTGYGVQALATFPETVQPWMIWLGTTIIGLIILWFVPRGIDVLILAPLAIYGGVQVLSLIHI